MQTQKMQCLPFRISSIIFGQILYWSRAHRKFTGRQPKKNIHRLNQTTIFRQNTEEFSRLSGFVETVKHIYTKTAMQRWYF